MKKCLLSFVLLLALNNLFAQHVISGVVYNDPNAGTINPSATGPVSLPPEELRVVLIRVVGTTETIAAVATVNLSSGAFTLPSVTAGNYYAMLITPNTSLVPGAAPPTLILESGWTYTGESWSGTTPDALVNGRTDVFTVNGAINTVRFGVQERPFARNKMNVLLNNASATAVPLFVNTGSTFTTGAALATTILEGADNNGGSITNYSITVLPKYGTLYMSGLPVTSLSAVTTLNSTQFNSLAYLPNTAALTQEMDFFTYTVTDNALTKSNNATYVIPFPLLDGDNDGVSNRFDMDSDNDGITNLAECNLNDPNVLFGEFGAGNFTYIKPSHFTPNSPTVHRVGQNYYGDLSTLFGKPPGSIIVTASNANTHPDFDEFYSNDSTGATQWTITGTLGSYTAIVHGQQYFSYDTRTITVLNGTPYVYVPYQTQLNPAQTGWSAGNDGQYNWWLTNNNPATNPVSEGLFVMGLIHPEPKYFQVESNANNFREWATYFVSILPECDDDNDGIPNRLDLDSDNDGCADALEGSDALARSTTSISTGTVSVGFGSTSQNRNLCSAPGCVDPNGIPFAVTTGGQTPVETYNPAIISAVCQQALPVTISAFTAHKNNKTVLLSWTTGSEQNNKGFEIERSTDGLSWNSIGFTPTAAHNGNSSQKINYNFTDNAAVAGQNFYRLKQTDFDGKFEYSDVRLVVMSAEKNVTIFPNPASTTLYIRGLSGQETITVFDVLGRAVLVQKATATTCELPLNRFANGTYQIQVVGKNGTSSTHRLVVSK